MELRTRGEIDAYQQGLDARSEALRLMGTAEYRAGDPATHLRVQRYFAEAYPGQVATSVHSPGQAPIGPSARGE